MYAVSLQIELESVVEIHGRWASWLPQNCRIDVDRGYVDCACAYSRHVEDVLARGFEVVDIGLRYPRIPCSYEVAWCSLEGLSQWQWSALIGPKSCRQAASPSIGKGNVKHAVCLRPRQSSIAYTNTVSNAQPPSLVL